MINYLYKQLSKLLENLNKRKVKIAKYNQREQFNNAKLIVCGMENTANIVTI
jgi:hypothetical protein